MPSRPTMSRYSRQEIDDAIHALKGYAHNNPSAASAVATMPAPSKASPAWRWTVRVLKWTIGGLIALVLPFIVLLRSSMFFYLDYGLNGWGAFALGAALTFLVLVVYAMFVARKIKGKPWISKGMLKSLGVVVGLYCAYAVLFISSANVKTPAVQETYTALHPLLRLAVSTVALADRDLVVTDGARNPADYVRMGLSVQENSLHYRQQDGYAHAIDLRTKGRAEWKNLMLTGYFRAMGFRTLRHVGTADHLHISLPVQSR